jgi:integrase
MREHALSHVEVPMPVDLMAIIRQTAGTGIPDVAGRRPRQAVHGRPLSRTGSPTAPTKPGCRRRRGQAARWCGLCTPHGLRKRCLTDLADAGKTIHQVMAVSGNLTMKEVERYTKMADRARNAREAMQARTEQVSDIESPKVSNH